MARERRVDPRGSRLGGLSGFLTRRPRVALLSWVVAVAVLAAVGSDLASQLHAHPLYIGGTEATRAHEITLDQFGSDESMIVALRGPRAAVDRQGRRLAARIDAMPKTLAVSPWSSGTAIGGLRPKPGVAGIVVRVGHRSDAVLSEMLEEVEEKVEATVRPPVQASIAGLPKIFTAYANANSHASQTGELIAIPVLLLVLLFVFRSVVAALIPVVVGGLVVAATEGVMRLLLGTVEIDAFALGAAGMMGLALGVDYSLLIVSRFREERKKAELAAAVRVTVEKGARSILPAAGGLILAMLIASQVLPGTVVSSSALTIVIATVFSSLSALFAVPAAIMLLGRNLERWSLPRRRGSRRSVIWVSSRVSRRPVAVTAIVLGLLVLAAISTTLDTGVATPGLLPKGEEGRIEEEQVEKSLGPGWVAPIEVVVSGRGEPMTTPRQLRSLVSLQDQVQHEKGVETVGGFNALQRNLKPLFGFEDQLTRQQRGVTKLKGSLVRTNDGASRASEGIRTAAAGAGEVVQGMEAAEDGVGLLAKGLGRTDTGSARLTRALGRASDGGSNLARTSAKASNGAGRLAEALEKGEKKIGETEGNVVSMEKAMQTGNTELGEAKAPLASAEEHLATAAQALAQMTVGSEDPQYAAAQQALQEARTNLSGLAPGTEPTSEEEHGVGGNIVRAQRQVELGLYLAEKIGSNNDKAGEGTEKLAKEAHRLEEGIEKLEEGATKMAKGVTTISAEGKELSPALVRLKQGTEALARHLGLLAGGAGELSDGLVGGAGQAERLAVALRRMHTRLADSSNSGGLRRLQRRSPNLFHSGYFYLASLDGSHPGRRALANFMIDVERGGHTARMMVIPRYPVTTAQGRETLKLVREDARGFARSTGSVAVVGGLSASQLSINDALRERTEIARLAMMLVTLLVLIPVLRSLTVPLLAAFLNLLTVFASLGVVALLFNGSLLGGPGYVDAADVPASMMVIFGLAIDYEVFVFARMREEYVRTGSPTQAVDNGLARTAPVITGAAVIMITVFLCFSVSEFVTLRNFGVAQAVAIFIDAFIIRLIVVPAVMKGLGRWSWWMPGWLDRLLPGGGAPGPASGPER
jgi:RND superfamily putative drug exporter